MVLIRAPYRAVFSYAGPDRVWQSSWHDAEQLPVAIRVLVRDAATQHTLAVSTATVLQVDVAAACAAAKSPKECVYPSRQGGAERRTGARQMKPRQRGARKTAGKSDDGFILVAVLWILGGLAVLAAIYTLYVVNAATSLEVNDDRIQADASVKAALELTAYYLGAVKEDERPASGQFNFRTGTANVAVNFLSESARIDLNAAAAPLLAGLFGTLGADARLGKIICRPRGRLAHARQQSQSRSRTRRSPPIAMPG